MSFDALLARVDQTALGILGTSVTYTPSEGEEVEVDGIFDALYVRVDLQQAGVSSQGPAVFLRLADLPSDPGTDTGATVTISGVEYRAHEVQPDGKGSVTLHLHRVS